MANPNASGWKQAVESGAFQDDADAQDVKGLDTIGNGRLHAINRSGQGQGWNTGRASGNAYFGQHHNEGHDYSWQAVNQRRVATDVSTYDPTNTSSKPADTHEVNSPARQWNAFQPNAQQPPLTARSPNMTTTSDARSVSLTHPQPSQTAVNVVKRRLGENNSAPVTTPSQDPSQLLLPHQRVRTVTHRDKPAAKSTAASTTATPTTAASANTLQPEHQSSDRANASIPPHLRPAVRVSRSPRPSSEEAAISSPGTTTSIVQNPGAQPDRRGSSSSAVSSVVLPHLRVPARKKDTSASTNLDVPSTSQTSASVGAAAELHQNSSAPSLIKDSKPQPCEVQKVPIVPVTKNAQVIEPQLNILYEENVKGPVKNFATGVSEACTGMMYLYQYPEREVIIWEVKYSNGMTVREDFRTFDTPFVNNIRKVIVRRGVGEEGPLRTTMVIVEGSATGDAFLKLCTSLRSRLPLSKEPRYPFTTEQYKPTEDNRIDISTLLPLGEGSVQGPPGSGSSTQSDPPVAAVEKPEVVVSEVEISETGPIPLETNVDDGLAQEAAIEPGTSTLKPASTPAVEYVLPHLRRTPTRRTPSVSRNHQQGAPASIAVDTAKHPQPQMSPPSISPFDSQSDALGGVIQELRQGQRHDSTHQAGSVGHDPEMHMKSESTEPIIEEVAPELTVQEASPKPTIEGASPEPTTEEASPEPIFQEETPEPTIKEESPEPLINSKPASSQLGPVDQINAITLANEPIGLGLDRPALSILSRLTRENYQELSKSFDESLYWLQQSGMYTSGSLREFVGVHETLKHLGMQTSFKLLGTKDRVKAAAVVYHNLKKIKLRGLIRYTAGQLQALRRHNLPAAPAVTLVNEFLTLRGTRQLTRPGIPQFAASPSPSSNRGESQSPVTGDRFVPTHFRGIGLGNSH
ncbi:hypothetical protein KJ359_013011 [Pestalotiopsis sp. 9143b]|nr:hypothetical protein KJ359_013011 [Pestalotiopsis sp. 9143b]